VPVNFTSRVDRNIDQRLDTLLDVTSFSSTLGFSSINLFGAMGTKPIFKFYRNDEYRHSITAAASFPKNEDAVWRIQAEQSATFYGFNEAELAVINTVTAGSTGWMDTASLLWSVPMKKSLLSMIYGGLMKRLQHRDALPGISALAESDYEKIRRESLEFTLDYTGDYPAWSFLLGHESLVRIIGRLTLSAFAKFGVSYDDYSKTTEFLFNFGTMLNVIF
jgi:hypothetical protein